MTLYGRAKKRKLKSNFQDFALRTEQQMDKQTDGGTRANSWNYSTSVGTQ